jgi:hypothetical protein
VLGDKRLPCFTTKLKNACFFVKKLMLNYITCLKENDLVTALCLQSRLELLISVCMTEWHRIP